jgi:hypothetical protein
MVGMTLPNYDIASIATPEQGLVMINKNLSMLRDIVRKTNFKDAGQRADLCNNIAFLKQYYERVDTLLAQKGL